MEAHFYPDGIEDVTYYYQGSYTRSVDEGGRFNLPFRFRRSGGSAGDEKFVLTEGPDRILCLMPHTEWLRAFKRIRRQGLDEKRRQELRRQSHNSEIMTPDSQGRIKVSPETLDRYGIGDKILVMGMGHYLELWNPEKHAKHQASLEKPDQGFMNEFFG
jgi:MraZ protein